jgi:hypothetical protein
METAAVRPLLRVGAAAVKVVVVHKRTRRFCRITFAEEVAMRSFDGQHSDRIAIRRTREQKERQLRELKEQLAGLKSHVAPAIRESINKRIVELQDELGAQKSPTSYSL